MKKLYEKPSIKKLQCGIMNKFGSSPGYDRKVRTEIDGVSIDDLVKEYGSPLFVYSEKTVRNQYRKMHNAFATRYPDVVFGWSYKTNYLQAICAMMHQEGAIAEVVSKMEYDKARKLGMAGEQIMFNGPHKSKEVLRQAMVEGAMINVDHLDEIKDLEEIADEMGQPLPVGIRLNLDAGIHPQWSRFGFNLESGQAMEAIDRMARRGKLYLRGVHCHIGTYILEPAAYARQVKKMLEFAYEVEDKHGFTMDYIDIGGGFPSKSKLKGSYLSADISVPGIDEYAEKITDALHENLRPGHLPRLVLESGRAMIDEAGTLITSVIASKRLQSGMPSYVVDAGINLLFTSFWYKFNIEMDRDTPGTRENSVVYGPMCMNIDVLDDCVMLPPLKRGTRLIVSPVGAYNNTQWLQFIEYRPNVVLIGPDRKVDIIREAEDLTDITRREKLPSRLNLTRRDTGVIYR